MNLTYTGKLLLLGYGAVGRSVLRLFLEHVRMPASRITVVDAADRREVLAPWLEQGVQFQQYRVTAPRLHAFLKRQVGAGDMIMDLTYNVDGLEVARWACEQGVLYVNASMEEWNDENAAGRDYPVATCLYARYSDILASALRGAGGPTAVIDHGANPGLVSHFACQGLHDLAAQVVAQDATDRVLRRQLEQGMADDEVARLAMLLSVRVIHCSEHDRQVPFRPKQPDEFVGHWSIEGMADECIMPVELGWGTHEADLPAGATTHAYGPGNQIHVPRRGMNTWLRSWVPWEEIVGMAIPHAESFSLSHHLTIRDGNRVLYRPSVYYVYQPSNETLASLHEYRCRGYRLQSRQRLLFDEIEHGDDALGVLLLGNPLTAWWTGSVLDIGAARRLVPRQNATTVQVAAGVAAAAIWAIRNPRRGLCFPEDLPWRDVLALARPWLGTWTSCASPWRPPAPGFASDRVYEADADADACWQFRQFELRP